MLRKTAEVDRGEAGLCPVPEGSGRRGEAHPTALWETEILFKETANTGTYLHSVTGKVPSSQLPNPTRSTREMTEESLGHWSKRREEASHWHTDTGTVKGSRREGLAAFQFMTRGVLQGTQDCSELLGWESVQATALHCVLSSA